MSGAKRHHYLPEFYLRQFATGNGKIRVYRVGGGMQPITTSVKNAAVESGFYKITEADPANRLVLEERLSEIEAAASAVLTQRLLRGILPSPQERGAFSVFMGLQMMRTPNEQRQFEAMVDALEKAFYENMTEEWARQRLPLIGREPTDDNVALIMDVAINPEKYRFIHHRDEFLRIMVTVAVRLADVIAARSWSISTSPGPAFITGDHPVVRHSREETPPHLTGIGLMDAEEVHFPLDRHHVLTLLLPGHREGTTVLRREDVTRINSLVAAYSYRFIFQHPDDPPMDKLIPKASRPLFRMNQQDVYEPNAGDCVRLSPLFSPHFARIPEDHELPPPGTLISPADMIHFMPPQPRPLV